MGQLHAKLRYTIAPRELRILLACVSLYGVYYFNRANRLGLAIYIAALLATLPFRYIQRHVLASNATDDTELTVSEWTTFHIFHYIVNTLHPVAAHRFIQTMSTLGNRKAGIEFKAEQGSGVHSKLPCIGYWVSIPAAASSSSSSSVQSSVALMQHIKQKPDSVYLLFAVHGGGFRFGQPAVMNGGLYSHLQQQCMQRAGLQLAVFTVEYRTTMDGEACPVATDDVLNAYHWLTQEVGVPNNHIIGLGDSAGGTALLSSVLQMPARKLQPPAAIALISPWLDLSSTAYEIDVDATSRDYITTSVLNAQAREYLGNVGSAASPIASPLYGLFSPDTVPPVWISYGGREVLRGQCEQLVERLVSANIHTTECSDPRMFHAYSLMVGQVAAADVSAPELIRWIVAVTAGEVRHGGGVAAAHVQRVLHSHPTATATARAQLDA